MANEDQDRHKNLVCSVFVLFPKSQNSGRVRLDSERDVERIVA